MTVAPAFAPVPPLAVRARSIGGSPVRDILAVTARPEVTNFAGGLPAPELFDAEGIAEAFRGRHVPLGPPAGVVRHDGPAAGGGTARCRLRSRGALLRR